MPHWHETHRATDGRPQGNFRQGDLGAVQIEGSFAAGPSLTVDCGLTGRPVRLQFGFSLAQLLVRIPDLQLCFCAFNLRDNLLLGSV